MDGTVKVVVLGTGQMGAGMIKLLLQKTGIDLVGVYGRRASRAGLDVGEALGFETAVGVRVSHDLPAMLGHTKPHVVLQATCSRLSEAVDEITTAVQHHAHVISIAEEMAYPAYQAPQTAAMLHQMALDKQVSVVGTGINPGFVLDLLVIALTGVCWRVDAIRAQRVNDLSPYGPAVLTSQGVGLTPAAFYQGVYDGTVVGHYGFPESISLIARAVGWQIDRIVQHREPIVSRVARTTPFVTIAPGHTAGCLHTAVAYRHDVPIITLIHPQQVHPHLEHVATGDSIDIDGEPPLHWASSPEIPGGLGTIALAVNMIPPVLNAAPGLHSMAELPVPAALMGDVRALRHARAPR